ncbi:dcl1 [Symbiodinium sp. CCMP2456]|nr:dcl1 [Symbiodinium sp. CCMP2456]
MDNVTHDWDAWAQRYGAWPHQLEAFRKALSQNSILNMPTGSGKTLVACMLLDALGVPSVFVVNSRALVVQQSEYLRRHSLQSFSVGSTPQAEVFVATGEVIRIALETGQIAAQQLRCVIFDEAHHAVGRHPYAEVLTQLREGCCPARILGLTASFLHGNSDPERRLEVLEDRFRAQAFSPQVHPALSHSERRFTAVPWFEAQDEAAFTAAAAYASYARHLDVLVENLAKVEFNWELQSSLAREKGRLRGVLESLGPAAWQPFVQESLVEVVQAKLSSKLAFADDAGDTECLQRALVLLPRCREVLARVTSVSDEVSGKFEALCQLLRRLLSGSNGSTDKILVFVERVSVAGPMARLLEASTGVEIAHVCGVQGMEEGLRQWNLQRFRTTCQVLVATTSLEEGLDVPDCRYVVRYDFFSSAKSHVQGAGRARHGEAEIFYFDNDPNREEDRRRRVEDALSREAPMGSEREPQRPEAPACSVLPSGRGEEEGAGEGGEGIGHAWGEEKTLWDYRQNKSFRGMTCACGALLHITSRAYGRGRKKKERIFSVQGAVVCPLSLSPIPELRQNGKRATGACLALGLCRTALFHSPARPHRCFRAAYTRPRPLGPRCHGPLRIVW